LILRIFIVTLENKTNMLMKCGVCEGTVKDILVLERRATQATFCVPLNLLLKFSLLGL